MSKTDWDARFLRLAQHVADWSKDPSTKVGAVLARGKFIISLGYNGFPPGVEDLPERLNSREVKYKMTLHAEENAILTARQDLTGCTMYTWPMQPCAPCTAKIIQAGIKRIVAPPPSEDHLSRWGEDFKLSQEMRQEAGIELLLRNP